MFEERHHFDGMHARKMRAIPVIFRGGYYMPDEKTEMTQAPSQTSDAVSLPERNWKQQIIGAILGGIVMFFILRIGELLGWHVANETMILFLGASIGSALTSLDHLDRAGARLTGRKSEGNRGVLALNVVIALVGMVVILGLMLGLSSGIVWLMGK